MKEANDLGHLKIFFGITGDNSVCHTCTISPGTYAGNITAGPIKLLEWLELNLGLSSIFANEAEIVLQLKTRLKELRKEELEFYQSFTDDPLGVSRRLLQLWDAWRLSGWDTEADAELPHRMKQLLAMKQVFNSISPGHVERIYAVLKALDHKPIPPLSLHLMDQPDAFPFLYQQLLQKLVSKSEVNQEKYEPLAKPGTDLRRLQNLLNGNNADAYQGDGSLQIVFFSNDITAANAVYAIQRQAGWNPVIVGNDISLLNGLHLSHNTPVCNWQSAAGNGQVSQLFFLATALFKSPVDCSQVVAFLSAPLSPFSKSLARQLLEVFAEKPGFENDGWNTHVKEYLEKLAGQPQERKKKKSVQFWLQHPRKLEQTGYDVSLLNDIYAALQSWASQSAQLDFYANYKEQLQHLSNLCQQLIVALKDEELVIPPARFERLQAELFADIPATIAEAQVGCSDAVNDPAGVWCKVPEILMMNAVRYEPAHYLTKFWYQSEKDFFVAQGLPLHDESKLNATYSDGLKRMIMNCSDRLVIAVPAVVNGAVAAKPFYLDEWEKMSSLEKVCINAGELLDTVPWDQEKKITRLFESISLPEPKDYLKISPDQFYRTKESNTSLEKLFQHPALWYMEYRLQLRHKAGASLPADSQLRGTLADTVVQHIFKEENKQAAWWKDDDLFRQQVMKVAEQVLCCEGLPFLETHYKRSLNEFKQTLAQSLCNLKTLVTKNHLVIAGTQQTVTGVIDNTPIKGYIDLLLKKGNQYYVIDLKWASSSKRYQDKLKYGTDLQLALYQQLYPEAVGSGYFLLNDGRLYMRNEDGAYPLLHALPVKADEGVAIHTIYEKAVKSLQYRRGEIAEGKLETGYHLPAEELMYVAEQEQENLYPLEIEKGFKKQPYDEDFQLFLGQIN